MRECAYIHEATSNESVLTYTRQLIMRECAYIHEATSNESVCLHTRGN